VSDNPCLSIGHSYQVRRSEFDKVLLDNSRRLGAEVIEGARVTEVDLNGGRQARVTGNDRTTTWSARFVVDASGRDTLLADRLGLKRINKRNNTAAVSLPQCSAPPRRQGRNDHRPFV